MTHPPDDVAQARASFAARFGQAAAIEIENLILAHLSTLRESRPVAPAAMEGEAESECVREFIGIVPLAYPKHTQQFVIDHFRAALAKELAAAEQRGYRRGIVADSEAVQDAAIATDRASR